MAAQMATNNIRDNLRRPDCVGALVADSVCEAVKLLVMSGIENYTVIRRAALLLARSLRETMDLRTGSARREPPHGGEAPQRCARASHPSRPTAATPPWAGKPG